MPTAKARKKKHVDDDVGNNDDPLANIQLQKIQQKQKKKKKIN